MAKFANSFTLELSERVALANGKKENKKVGEAKIPCPILSDFGIAAEIQKDKEGKEAYEDGLPLYADPRFDFLQDAIKALISVRSRNRFEKGSLKAGMSLAEDFDSLFEQSGRTGEALAIRREAKASFEAFLQKLGKKAATVQALSDLFYNSSKSLVTAEATYVEALAIQVGRWIESLNDAQKGRFAPKIAELQESINAAQEGADLEDMKS